MTKKLHLIWFCHQPFFIPDHEILSRVHSTYFPVLDAHIERNIPITFGMTAGTLERINSLVPDFIVFLRAAIAAGNIKLLGTAAFHPILPELGRIWLDRQIEYDKNTRANLDLQSIPLFWPTELAWSMRLARVLCEHGYSSVVVNNHCIDLMNTAPRWNKSGQFLNPKPFVPDSRPRHSRIRIELESGTSSSDIDVVSRNDSISNGIVGLLHKNCSHKDKVDSFMELLDTELTNAMDKNSPIVLGEDPERILPERLGDYLRLLDHLVDKGINFSSIDDLFSNPPSAYTKHVPSGTMQGSDELWSSTVEDRWFRGQLTDLLNRHAKFELDALYPSRELIERKVMQIQDSGFYFWPYIARTRSTYFEKMAEIDELLNTETGK